MSKIPLLREVIRDIASHSAGIIFEKYDGSISITTMDDPGSVSRNIEDSEILTDQNNLAIWDYSYTSVDLLITQIELFYKPIHPLDGGWVGRVYANRSSLSDLGVLGVEYSGYLDNAYNTINEDRKLTIYAPGIRDEDTAKNLARLWIEWRTKPLAMMSLECSYSVLDIEFGDKIGVTATTIHSFLRNKTWLVIGYKINPNILNKQPSAVLELIEVGGSSQTEPTEWVDTFATGDEKTDTFSTGEIIQEVF